MITKKKENLTIWKKNFKGREETVSWKHCKKKLFCLQNMIKRKNKNLLLIVFATLHVTFIFTFFIFSGWNLHWTRVGGWGRCCAVKRRCCLRPSARFRLYWSRCLGVSKMHDCGWLQHVGKSCGIALCGKSSKSVRLSSGQRYAWHLPTEVIHLLFCFDSSVARYITGCYVTTIINSVCCLECFRLQENEMESNKIMSSINNYELWS